MTGGGGLVTAAPGTSHPCSSTFIFLFESQQPLFPPCLTSSLEWTSSRTSPTCWWWIPVHVTVISSFSHHFIIIIIIIITTTTAFTMHHCISIPLQTRNLPFPQTHPTIISLTFSDGFHGCSWPFPDLTAHRFLFLFLFVSFFVWYVW